tara:strand:- start:53855 stop:54370 length:516 start_codon:yes stop_codon:yes gene_type:complete
MITVIPKVFILTVLIIALNVNSTIAQVSEPQSVSISVTAQVSSAIELFTIQSVDFRYEDVELNVLSVDPISNPSAGKMVARGMPDSAMRISFLQSRELVNVDTNHVLFFEYFVAGNDLDEQESSEIITPDNRDLTFNEEGEYYIWVGGRVDLSTAQPGSYEGDFNIEIEYI